MNAAAPLRILCCSSTLEGGGSERQMAALVRHLDRSRFAPEILLLHRRGPYLSEIPSDIPIHCYDESVPPFRLNWPGRVRSSQVKYIKRILRERRIDLVYDRAFHMTQIVAPAANSLAIPRISTIVNSPQADFLAYEKKYLWLKRRFLASAYRTATKVVALSRGLAVELQRYYHVPSDKVQVVYSPIDQDDILAKSHEACPDLDSPNCQLRIICVGRLCEQKGQIYLLEAVKQLVHEKAIIPHLHMVGDGPLKGKLIEYCRENQIQSHVTWHGFLSNPFPLFQRANLLCLPSLYEGLPNVVMEAMFLGLPILATDCPTGPRELLGDDRFGKLIPVRSASAITEQVVDRLKNPETWLKRAELAKEVVKERHSLQHWLSVMQELFIRAVQEGKRP